MAEEELLPFCECGECGLRVTKKGNRFIKGHNRRGKSHTSETCAKISEAEKGIPNSPEHNAAIKKALTGMPRTPEHSAAIARSRTPEFNSAMSDTIKNSEAAKSAVEAQRGGNDLVDHHYIYDHADLSKNTVKMARKDHSRLHQLLKKLGYIVPHINVSDE